MPILLKGQHQVSTQTAFLWTRLLNVPFWVILNILPIILYKDLKISSWLVTLMIIIKPASALFASYWGSWIHERQDRLISNIALANVIRYLPFLFMPWLESPLIIISAFGLYMMLSRGVMPAWMEIFKLNLNNQARSRVFSYGSALDYFFTALFPIVLGLILDDYALSWRFLFPVSALLGLFSTLFVLKLPKSPRKEQSPLPLSIKEEIVKPWKQAFVVLNKSPGFFRFQMGFFFGGAGLMIIQSVIPIFFVDTLHLSYTKMLIAIGVCKAIGYALLSPAAITLFDRLSIYKFSGLVSMTAACFPLLLITSELNSGFIYLAYFLYGAMQAGSELSWHMSGPIFSRESDSSPYSNTNVLLVGIRGCIAPLLGALLFYYTNSITVLLAGALLSTVSAKYLINNAKELRLYD